MELGVVRQVDIDHQMQQAYLDYAMSVIVSRALPDARDGLKPVHRRNLYAMHDMGLRAEQPYRKSARIVGEVLGKYHPHGDMAVYEAMVRMAQDFSMRLLLVDGQGNFGSVDGDAPAAMRYTEARLAPAAGELLRDLEKDTVDWTDNFDGTLQEPNVLPASIPNLLVNGSAGIAVGMATSVPPHNLTEVIDALVYSLDRWEHQEDIGVEDLMQFIHGPDFPTAGILFRRDSAGEDVLQQAYGSGRGKFILQAKAHVEEMSRGRNRIVITELPYQVNKSALQERIAELVRDEKLTGLTDVRDESDRQGMRLVIELTRNVEPEAVLADLFKHTAMRTTFSINILALVDGEPRLLTLKKALLVYLEHRLEIVRRRSQYELKRARERAHILAGLIKALDNLDQVIEIIRRSKTSETARKNLMVQLQIDDRQADAILDLPLRRLAVLERRKIDDEYKEKLKLIKELETLLASPKKQRERITAELLEVKQRYGEPRRTLILDQAKGTLTGEDLLPDEDIWLTVTRGGLVSRTPRPAGSQAPLASMPESTAPAGDGAAQAMPWLSLSAHTRERLVLLTADARAVSIPVHQAPNTPDPAAGMHWADLSAFGRREKLVAGLVYRPGMDGSLLLATAGGEVKRLALAELPIPGAEPISLMTLAGKDRLVTALWTPGDGEVILATAAGQALRLKETEIPVYQAAAGGVQGIRLATGDRLVNADRLQPGAALLTLSDTGYGKRTELDEYPTKGRATAGVAAAKLSPGAELLTALVVQPGERLVLVTAAGWVTVLPVAEIPLAGRATIGRSLVQLETKERVRSAALLPAGEQAPTLEAPVPANGQEKTAKREPKPAALPANGKVAPDGKKRLAKTGQAVAQPASKRGGQPGEGARPAREKPGRAGARAKTEAALPAVPPKSRSKSKAVPAPAAATPPVAQPEPPPETVLTPAPPAPTRKTRKNTPTPEAVQPELFSSAAELQALPALVESPPAPAEQNPPAAAKRRKRQAGGG